MTAAMPSGIVTFLFTDVEGSTRRWEAYADAMRTALEAHNQVLREAVKYQAPGRHNAGCRSELGT